jgi:phage N-6-adenine-methyltransferase
VTIVGFVPKNHPQQVQVNGAEESADERYTLADVFEPLDREFFFTLDAAATAENTKCRRFYDRATDGLAQSWAGETIWLNPPFSDLPAWVRKAREETLNGGCRRVVVLLPANRTEQPWWQDYIEPVRDRPGTGVTTRFVRRRRNFGRPGQPDGKYKTGVPFGLVVVVFEGSHKCAIEKSP